MLALAPAAVDTEVPDTAWSSWSRYFPWEDWRGGRPALIDQAIAPALERWAGRSEARRSRARLLFALEGSPWNDERVLDRYELLYEAGLAPEAAQTVSARVPVRMMRPSASATSSASTCVRMPP